MSASSSAPGAPVKPGELLETAPRVALNLSGTGGKTAYLKSSDNDACPTHSSLALLDPISKVPVSSFKLSVDLIIGRPLNPKGKDVSGIRPTYPIIADEDLKVAKLFNMLEGDAGTSSMGRTAVDNETVRTIFVVMPDKRIGLYLTYPMATGRNFHEILRAIDSMQLTANHKVATPANWKKGEDVVILPAVKNEEAEKIYPDGWETVKPYLRKVPDPSK